MKSIMYDLFNSAGLTCYLSAVLQGLFNIPQFRKNITKCYSEVKTKQGYPAIKKIGQFFEAYLSKNTQNILECAKGIKREVEKKEKEFKYEKPQEYWYQHFHAHSDFWYRSQSVNFPLALKC